MLLQRRCWRRARPINQLQQQCNVTTFHSSDQQSPSLEKQNMPPWMAQLGGKVMTLNTILTRDVIKTRESETKTRPRPDRPRPRPGRPRPRPDQDQTGPDRDRDRDQGGRDQDQDQDQHGRDQDQHPRPRPSPLMSWSRPAHTNSFHSSTFEYCTAVNVIMHKNIEIGLSNNK